jgi:hypothetical protein
MYNLSVITALAYVFSGLIVAAFVTLTHRSPKTMFLFLMLILTPFLIGFGHMIAVGLLFGF